jgi:acyl-ACP thioesterase
VSARLRHPAPSDAAELGRFRFRASECDLAGHVNNAAYWQPIEEELLGGDGLRQLDGEGLRPNGGKGLEQLDAEIEYRAPAQPGDKLILGRGDRRWIAGEDGEVHASILLRRPDAPR